MTIQMNTSDYPLPIDSPWGEVTEIDEIADGIYKVDTALHTGLMIVPHEAEMRLSKAARSYGFEEDGFICFSGDDHMAVVYSELLQDEDWELPDCFTCSRKHFEDSIRATLMFENPDYLDALKKECGIDYGERADLEQIAAGRQQAAKELLYPIFSSPV